MVRIDDNKISISLHGKYNYTRLRLRMNSRESVFSTFALQKRNSFETNLGQLSDVQGICIEGWSF